MRNVSHHYARQITPGQRRRAMLRFAVFVAAVAVATAVTGAAPVRAAEPIARPRSVPSWGTAAAPDPVAAEVEKAKAAAALGIVPTDEQLKLRDKEFVIALWRVATGREVRASAELAFTGSDLECTEWIKHGIHEARARDQANKIRDAEAADAARESKERALVVLGIVPDTSVTMLGTRDFVYAIVQRQTGPRVHAAALAAFGAPEAAQQEFIATGIRTAHAQDQQDGIDADQHADAAMKARLAAEAARGRAVSVVGVPATPDVVSRPDDDILRIIANHAKPGSEVEKAAVIALRSLDRADWTNFVVTGVFAANRRDLDAVLQRKADADRALVQQIKDHAVQTGVQPRLAKAAAAALTGGVTEVRDFLRKDRVDALTQSLLPSPLANPPGQGPDPAHGAKFLRDVDGVAIAKAGSLEPGPADGLPATWRVGPGLIRPEECVSLESVTKPNHYLAHVGDAAAPVRIAPIDGTAGFAEAATWCPDRSGAEGTVRLEEPMIAGVLGVRADGTAVTGNPASSFDWWVMDPNPDSTAITARWIERWLAPTLPRYDPYQDLVYFPLEPEQVDGPVRFRDFYDKGTTGKPRRVVRVYWSAATGAHQFSVAGTFASPCPAPDLLDAYLALGGHRAGPLGPPSSESQCTAGNTGVFKDFAAGGSMYSSTRSGAHIIYGAIKAKWISLGAEKSSLGFPTSDEFAIPGGRRSTFEHGRIDFDATTGVVTAYPA
ncbi:AbfB domain-containing protein [Amycolatopsis sp. NPDC004079]|uniref:AbfB domain-containing protein n=1 Tax=Amycolatopsis sp. NPDC004079 TaxID=3154549 RepID=UPI0033BC68AA